MEKRIRTILYNQLGNRPVAYNPVEPEPFDLVDLTRDITNSTRIYHKRTACVREALEGASLIVTDSQALAHAVALALPRAIVTAVPFGPVYAAAIEPNKVPIVGLLNHTGEMEMNNRYALKLLKSLKLEIMVYGEELPGIEGKVIGEGDFGEFAAMCDILLLPSMPGVINSTTLPLSLMSGNTAILASNAPGYYELSAATGVQLLPHDPGTWWAMVRGLIDHPTKLKALHERNKAFANRLNRDSYHRLASLADQFIVPPAPLSEGCGCAKKAKSVTRLPPVVHGGGNTRRGALTQPKQDQLILEKESNS